MQHVGISSAKAHLKRAKLKGQEPCQCNLIAFPGSAAFHENLRQAFLALVSSQADQFHRINKLEATLAALKRKRR